MMAPAPPASSGPLLGAYTHVLDRLEFVSRAPGRMDSAGRRRGAGTGYSVDFADYRKYNRGDDVRHIDWSIYARLRKLFLRQFRAESDLAVHLLLDTSRSMDVGGGSKLPFACRLAAMFGYVALGSQDRVGLATFSDRLHRVLPPQRGLRHLPRILELLDAVRPEGTSDLEQAFRAYAARASTRGLLIVLTDCYCAGGYERALRCLAFGGFEVVVVRVMADEELRPAVDDEGVDLRDLERPDAPGLPVTAEAVGRYLEDMSTYSRTLAAFCSSEGIRCVEIPTSLGLEHVTARLLHAGLWRNR